jgi:hypothetical protein
MDAPIGHRQLALGEFGNRTGHFHAGGSGTDDAEAQQSPTLIGARLHFGPLEGFQHAAADFGSVLNVFKAGGKRFPFLVAEVGMSRTGGNCQIIVCDS